MVPRQVGIPSLSKYSHSGLIAGLIIINLTFNHTLYILFYSVTMRFGKLPRGGGIICGGRKYRYAVATIAAALIATASIAMVSIAEERRSI